MRKVVYNAQYGGFGLSEEGLKMVRELSGNPAWNDYECDRHDPALVQTVEALGDKSFGSCATLRIEEVNQVYRIKEFDGKETVEELYLNEAGWIL